jgi:hypothetical protein
MRNLLFVALLFVGPSLARAGTPAQDVLTDVLTDEEHLRMCAEALPKELECKKEFCAAMVKIRAGDKKVDAAAMEGKCLEEIAVDGTGDLAVREARCAGWQKERPKMSVARADGKEMEACWAKATCGEKIDCWAPKMKKMMEAAAPPPKAKK